jgi:hypothetical protein
MSNVVGRGRHTPAVHRSEVGQSASKEHVPSGTHAPALQVVCGVVAQSEFISHSGLHAPLASSHSRPDGQGDEPSHAERHTLPMHFSPVVHVPLHGVTHVPDARSQVRFPAHWPLLVHFALHTF